jgi:hypothetical protein
VIAGLLLACVTPDTGGAADSADTAPPEVTDYQVESWTDPSPALAGEEAEFYVRVTDQDGNPIEDLQTNHERIIHTAFVSADLEFFAHLHHEDFYDIAVDDLRTSTFHFPVTFPFSGEYLTAWNFAHRNEWLSTTGRVAVGGAVAPRESYDPDYATERDLGDVRVSLAWNVRPLAGYEASLTVTVTDPDGNAVTDLVPYLGADGHLAVVTSDLSWASHTHAWFPGMEDMSPSMDMPHVYDGPELPFNHVFPVGGTYKMWIQFARASAPGVVYVAPFLFDVSG